ncbi:SusC/RagA family TonB-linked outer membrane protein [Chitinophaga pinensis]|uniref:TonB-dependent receptor plug n=1 Tax=Chitinophaga pinensis (strain ATCC 43595 / DSM 2588 / LMG 13176 / NBRC 15968 / NCIMB 11800 / UQM 2034) TaxID=485918 RepID=A0A979GXF8_CHIPD|nr:TonB-dependent receptor [Chitinophaga pinensis]ACU62524.1 TonB-dependent receptor plug [Chitinophaga pinensis DSM 2588]
MKKTRFARYAFLLCFVLISLFTYAQSGSISGKVTDDAGQPIPGATVFIKGTSKNATADAEGKFTITGITPGNIVVVARIMGYETFEMPVNAGNSTESITFQLKADTKGLNEIVVVGYGTQKKSDLTGAIAVVSSKDFNKGPISSADQLITGKVPGVQITSNGGAPGAGSTIRVRGGASLNATNDPLIIIDGVPVDNNNISGASNALALINPNDIESFNVLKDASATAIYGSRASNGVIIITTKKGRLGDQLHVSFSSTNAISKVTSFSPVLNASQFSDVVKQNGTAAQIALLGTDNTDWQKQIYQSAFSTDNNLALSGSWKKLPYRISVGYLNQDGILKTSNLERNSASINLSPSLFDDHLKINMNVKGSIADYRFADQGAINAAIAYDPTKPLRSGNSNDFGGYYEWLYNGKLYDLATKNPAAMLEQKMDKSQVKRSIGNIQFDYKFHFLPELRANLNLGYDYQKGDGNTNIPKYAALSYYNGTGGSYKHYSQEMKNKLFDFYLNYVKELKGIKSRIDVMGGYSYQDFITATPGYPTLDESGDTTTAAGNYSEAQHTLVSFFGRLNYTFNDKYLLTFTMRRDGTSRFRQHWGNFPSVAFAWKLKDEPFLKNTKTLSDLKLRLGYGVTGQENIGVGKEYAALSRYTYGDANSSYQLGDVFYKTLRAAGYDQNIKWEQTATYNVAVDYGFLDNKITGSVDFYYKKTTDLLADVTAPTGTNLTNTLYTNIGSLENRGVEFIINATPVETKDFRWDAGFNITYNKNKILSLSKAQTDTSVGIATGGISGGTGNTIQINTAGNQINSFYVYKQIYDKAGNPIEGVYEDTNGDGVVDADDKYRYKSSNPVVYLNFNSSFNYKKWTLGFSMRSNIGNYIYNNQASNNGSYKTFQNSNYLANLSTSVLKTKFRNTQYWSDYYVENGSFLRMDYLNLGYDFGRVISKKVGLRANFNVQNVFVITKYSGQDPEVFSGIDDKFYPRPRVYSLGVNLDF